MGIQPRPTQRAVTTPNLTHFMSVNQILAPDIIILREFRGNPQLYLGRIILEMKCGFTKIQHLCHNNSNRALGLGWLFQTSFADSSTKGGPQACLAVCKLGLEQLSPDRGTLFLKQQRSFKTSFGETWLRRVYSTQRSIWGSIGAKLYDSDK